MSKYKFYCYLDLESTEKSVNFFIFILPYAFDEVFFTII